MIKTSKSVTLLLFMLILWMSGLNAQTIDGGPFNPEKDANIDMYMSSWKNSMPQKSHGCLIERDILTKGDPLHPTRPGAVLKYVNRFAYATLDSRDVTAPITLKGEQEILYFTSGSGVLKTAKSSHDLHEGICVLVPANLEFTIANTGDDLLTMYLINEPIPEGFRPNPDVLVKDENLLPVGSAGFHWAHIEKGFFKTRDGLGTLENVITITFDPMTIGHPHCHVEGTEEVWTQVRGRSIVNVGKLVRWQEPGMGYLAPPDMVSPHSNINMSDKPVKLFYFARYDDHEVRK